MEVPQLDQLSFTFLCPIDSLRCIPGMPYQKSVYLVTSVPLRSSTRPHVNKCYTLTYKGKHAHGRQPTAPLDVTAESLYKDTVSGEAARLKRSQEYWSFKVIFVLQTFTSWEKAEMVTVYTNHGQHHWRPGKALPHSLPQA